MGLNTAHPSEVICGAHLPLRLYGDRLRWVWSCAARQADPTEFPRPTWVLRSAWNPTEEVRGHLAALVRAAALHAEPPPKLQSTRIAGSYAGVVLADPRVPWPAPPRTPADGPKPLYVSVSESWSALRPSPLVGSPAANPAQIRAVGGIVEFYIGSRFVTAVEDSECRIETALVSSALAAGETRGLWRAGINKALWLPQELRSAVVADAQAAQSSSRPLATLPPKSPPTPAGTTQAP